MRLLPRVSRLRHPTARSARPHALLACALAVVAGACGAPHGPTAAPSRALLLVVNSVDGTITRLDADSGAVAGPPLAAGGAPWQIASGPSGGVLVVSSSAPRGTLAYLSPGTPVGRGAWTSRVVRLDVNPEVSLLDSLMASDGQQYAAVTYRARGGPAGGAQRVATTDQACRLAVLTLSGPSVLRTQELCRPEERPYSLAVGNGPEGAVVYAGLWSWPRADPRGGGRGRVLAIDALTGVTRAVWATEGAPTWLAVAPSPAAAHRLYALELAVPHRQDDGADLSDTAVGGRVWELNAAALTGQPITALDPPLGLALSPVGDALYVLSRAGGRSTDLVRIDLLDGSRHLVSTLDGIVGGGPAVTGNRIYVLDAAHSRVWPVDRASGSLLRPIRTGRGARGLLVAG